MIMPLNNCWNASPLALNSLELNKSLGFNQFTLKVGFKRKIIQQDTVNEIRTRPGFGYFIVFRFANRPDFGHLVVIRFADTVNV